MKDTNDIPQEPTDAGSTDLQFTPTDPETARLVNEFIQQKTGKSSPAPPESQNEPEPHRVEIQPNKDFDKGDPVQQVITEALPPVEGIPITDLEKELFLKAVLCDAPVRLPIKLYRGQMAVELRSRSAFEQKRVFDILKEDLTDGLYQDGDVSLMVTRMHYYLAALMVERINGELFSDLKLIAGKTLEEDKTIMRQAVDKLFSNIGTIRWTSILNALRIFEHKCARMNTEAINEDFWNPQSSD